MKKLLLPKSYYLEFAAATLLYIVNVLLTLFFPYFTAHKAYYDSTAYITVLTTAYLIYVIRIHLTAKKSASDIAVVLFAFFILWELSYKLGFIHNDLLIPSPEGLFHVFVEKPAEIGADVIGSLQLLFWGFLLAVISGTTVSYTHLTLPTKLEV